MESMLAASSSGSSTSSAFQAWPSPRLLQQRLPTFVRFLYLRPAGTASFIARTNERMREYGTVAGRKKGGVLRSGRQVAADIFCVVWIGRPTGPYLFIYSKYLGKL